MKAYTSSYQTIPTSLPNDIHVNSDASTDIVYPLLTTHLHQHQTPNTLSNYIQNISNQSQYLVFQFIPSRKLSNIRLLSTPLSSNQSKASVTLIQRPSIIIVGNRVERYNRIIVGDGSISGFAALDPLIDDPEHFQLRSSIVKCELWQGNHYFILNGKIMFGSDLKAFIAFNIFIVSVSIAFFIKIVNEFPMKQIPRAITMTLLLALFSYSYSNLWLAALTEPGIIPRNPRAKQDNGKPTPYDLNVKYCQTCNIDRPPGTKHCRKCQVCVEEFDHHCPFVGTCLGLRNYRYFLRFLISFTLFTEAAAALSVTYFVAIGLQSSHSSSVNSVLRKVCSKPIALIVAVVSCCGIWYLHALCGYHMFLLSIGQTTNQHIKQEFRNIRNHKNNGCVGNTINHCCSEIPTSRINNMSQIMSCKQYISEVCGDASVKETTSPQSLESVNAWNVVSSKKENDRDEDSDSSGEDNDSADILQSDAV